MRRYSFLFLFMTMLLIAACGSAPTEPTAAPTLTPFPTREQPATRTPIGNVAASVTPFVVSTSVVQPTAFLPATAILPATSVPTGPILLNGGRGLSNGAPVSNGEFQVEGYCDILNPQYGVSEDRTDWFCTFEGQRALTLRQDQFDDICQRTYNNSNAVAIQVNNGEPLAYQWRCYEVILPPTPTPAAPPQLLSNGRGLTTGALVNNGEFQVEGYCTAINSNYGIDVDQNFWYCTENGNRILTLGVAEFDDVCIRTYNNPAAFAEQIQNNDRPAYRWRCFVLPS